MKIRPATIADAGGIARVSVDGWRIAYAELLPTDFLRGLSETARQSNWREILSRADKHVATFVAEKDGEVIGFANGGPERTNDPHFVGEVYAIYLRQSYQRQGIGSALFQKLIEFLRSEQMISIKVWVLRDNPYRRFYEQQGGRVIEEKLITIAGTELIETAYGWD